MINSLSVGVVGVGISGLSCARALAAAGGAVTLLEKSRSLGGRCASRRWEGHVVDHGAQYFTLRDEAFRAEVTRVAGAHLRRIEAAFVDGDGHEIPETSPRWYHAEGNNRLGKGLCGELAVRFETTVASLEPAGTGWRVAGEVFDAVVISAPWPQAMAILGRPAGGEPSGAFVPCLTAFFAYAGDFAGNSAGVYARRVEGSPLAWSACENHKAGRVLPGTTVFVAQASPEFSAEHLELDPAAWAERLREPLERAWELPSAARGNTFTHRWRFARCVGRVGTAAMPDLPPGLFVTGDATTESRVESAWRAGRETAERVRRALGR